MLERVLCLVLFLCSFTMSAQDTVLKLYRPFADTSDKSIPLVSKTVSGECVAQSQLITRQDAWRCIAEGKTYDPCFVKSGNHRMEALCLRSPWARKGVQVKVEIPLDNGRNQALDMSSAYPWAIELGNGVLCQAISSTELYDEMSIRYQCNNQNQLLGHLQRCKTVWSMLEKTPSGLVITELARVWF